MEKNKITSPAIDRSIRNKLYEIIFEADTPAGKGFDIVLLWGIILSVLVVFLESISELRSDYGDIFYYLECFFTILFTFAYFFRILNI